MFTTYTPGTATGQRPVKFGEVRATLHWARLWKEVINSLVGVFPQGKHNLSSWQTVKNVFGFDATRMSGVAMGDHDVIQSAYMLDVTNTCGHMTASNIFLGPQPHQQLPSGN